MSVEPAMELQNGISMFQFPNLQESSLSSKDKAALQKSANYRTILREANMAASVDGGSSTMSNFGPGAVLPQTLDASNSRKRSGTAQFIRRIIVGLCLVILSGSLWVGAVELAKETYQWPNFYAPFFVIYFSTVWIILLYPMYIAAHFIHAKGKVSLKETFREDIKGFGDDGFYPRPLKLIAKCALFCVLWMVTNYSFIRAISYRSCVDVTTIFTSNPSFVYLLSWIVLQKKFMAIRIVALILAMTGICMLIHMDGRGFANSEMWGSVLALIATAGAATYKVLFKKVIGDMSFAQVSLFMTFLGLSILLTMWPIFLALYFTDTEPITWSLIPWGFLCGATICALLFNMILNFSGSVTYPLLVQFGLIFSIPVCIAVDLLWRDLRFNGMQIGAIALCCTSFLLNTLPENWYDGLLKALKWQKLDADQQRADAIMSPRQRLRSSTAC